MSLINDALKRARQHQAQRPSQPPPGVPLQPVERHGGGGLSRVTYPALLIVALMFGGWAFWKFLQASAPKTQSASLPAAAASGPALAKTSAPTPEPERAPTLKPAEPPSRTVQVNTTLVTRVASPGPAPVPANPPPTVPAAALPAEPATTSPTVATVSTTAPPTATPSSAAATTPPALPAAVRPAEAKPTLVSGTFPDLHLQAIFYRLNKPSVMINGRTCYTGDMIGDAKLTRIERDHVVVVRQGEARHLNLR